MVNDQKDELFYKVLNDNNNYSYIISSYGNNSCI
jgi:hypothetical protein